jgi:hypothetical protein
VRTGKGERDYISDTSGNIHLGGKNVVEVSGRKIGDVREDIIKVYPDAEINFISREGDIPINYGQVYYFNFKTGQGGQEPIYGRRLKQLGAKFEKMMAGDYFFVFRDNDSKKEDIKYFALIAEVGELLRDSKQNIKLAHNDLVVGGKPDTLIENLEELLHKSAACWRDIKSFK